MDVRVAFENHHLVDLDCAGFTNTPQIVALKINEHDVLSALLWMRKQFRGQIVVSLAIG